MKRLPHSLRGGERLEDRLALAGDGVVGDALFAFYDGGVATSGEAAFSRDTATIAPDGTTVAADARRYGEALDYSAPVAWEDAGVELRGVGKRVALASGWDHDGQTPLMVWHAWSEHELTFYRGEGFSIANSVRLPNNDLMRGAVAGEKFAPKAAIVHHGLVVIAAERWVIADGQYAIVGVDFFTTQDYGVTFERVPMAGGEYGVPVLEGSAGKTRLASWSFSNPFPVNGYDDATAAWFPWADYIRREDHPQGGQIGLFRADRSSDTGLWQVRPNRLVFSEWIEEDSGGLHAHTAAVTAGGLISHWGDVGYRSNTKFHRFELDNYETAPVETVIAYGGYSPEPGPQQEGPQPVAAAPSPAPGEHFAGGDLTAEHILAFGSLSETTDRLEIGAINHQPEANAPGGNYWGAEVLHFNWVQGSGYVAAANQDNYYYYSPNGYQWTELRRPVESSKSRLWLYGDRLLSQADDRLWLADPPVIESVDPLLVAPGGTNLLDTAPEPRRPTGPGNTLREVEYAAGVWRYADDQTPLGVQPPAPSFDGGVVVYEASMGAESSLVGSWWVQPEGDDTDSAAPHATEVWAYNLATQSVSIGASHFVVDPATGESTGVDARHFSMQVNTEWIQVGVTSDLDGGVTGRLGVTIQSSGIRPASRFLVAVAGASENPGTTYPMAPLATGSDELETLAVARATDNWSLGLVAQWPRDARQNGGAKTPIASLTGPSGDAVQLSVEYARTRRFYLEVYREGELIEAAYLAQQVLRGDWFEVIATRDGRELTFTLMVSGNEALSTSIDSPGPLAFDQFVWAGRDGDVSTGVNPVLVTFDADKAWDAEQRDEWIGSSLQEKALYQSKPAPGDFNSDGVVNGADADLWHATQYTPTPGRPGDANLDGWTDAADLAIWRACYGQSGSGLAADFNGDLVVDAADYVLWRNGAAPQVEPGTGADADGNGFIERADLDIWYANFGTVYPSFDDLRTPIAAAAASEPEALIVLATNVAEEPDDTPPRPDAPSTNRVAVDSALLLLVSSGEAAAEFGGDEDAPSAVATDPVDLAEQEGLNRWTIRVRPAF